jgi:hypothetical protein
MNNNILAQGAWWPVNKAFTQKYGIDASILVSDLVSKQGYFEDNHKLDAEGFFFNDKEQIELNTSLSSYRQDKAREVLVDCGVLLTKVVGTLPPRRMYKVESQRLNEIIFDLHSTGEFKLLKEKKTIRA